MLVLGNIQNAYAASEGTSDKVAAEMLQLNLDIVTIQSHIGLTLLLYAAANRDSIDDDDYVVYFDKYMSDVQDLINIHFNSNSTKSIPYIFEHR